MGKTTEELKEVGKLRKAMLPLFKLLPDALVEANEKRFDLIEKKLEELSVPQPVVNVTSPDVVVPKIDAPNVTVKVDTEAIVAAIEKANTTKVKPTPSAYEPHDQAKTQVYQYSGFVRSDGEWYIQRVAKGEQRYAKGQSGYADAWERRSKLKYGYIDA